MVLFSSLLLPPLMGQENSDTDGSLCDVLCSWSISGSERATTNNDSGTRSLTGTGPSPQRDRETGASPDGHRSWAVTAQLKIFGQEQCLVLCSAGARDNTLTHLDKVQLGIQLTPNVCDGGSEGGDSPDVGTRELGLEAKAAV